MSNPPIPFAYMIAGAPNERAADKAMQTGIDYYAQRILALIQEFPAPDAPLYIAVMETLSATFPQVFSKDAMDLAHKLENSMVAVAIKKPRGGVNDAPNR